jgi:hypothetical protein
MRAWAFRWELTVALLLGWCAVRLLPFNLLASLLGHSQPAGRTGHAPMNSMQKSRAHGIGRSLEHRAKHLPWHATCLMQVTAGRLMLSRRGIPTVARFGLQRMPDGSHAAHAWLLTGGETILGGVVAGEFEPIADFIGRRTGTS